jgi:hypothetical protein
MFPVFHNKRGSTIASSGDWSEEVALMGMRLGKRDGAYRTNRPDGMAAN